jgi:hypothetical protein
VVEFGGGQEVEDGETTGTWREERVDKIATNGGGRDKMGGSVGVGPDRTCGLTWLNLVRAIRTHPATLDLEDASDVSLALTVSFSTYKVINLCRKIRS